MTFKVVYPVLMDQDTQDRILESVPEKARDAVLNTGYTEMVQQLAKPGEEISNQMTYDGFLQLGTISAHLITLGNQLDLVKKQVIYNKAVHISEAEYVALPLDAMPAFSRLTGEQAHLLHMAVGMAGEGIEMLHQIFNHIYHGAELDVANVVEEGGDASFFIQGLIGPLCVGPEEMLFSNKAKLIGKRFPNGYSDQAAQARADKEPGQ